MSRPDHATRRPADLPPVRWIAGAAAADWAQAALVAAVYAAFAALAMTYVDASTGIAALWPAAGVAAGALALARPAARGPMALGIVVAGMAVNLGFGAGPGRSLAFAAANTASAAVFAIAFGGLAGSGGGLRHPADVLRLAVAAVAAGVAGATLGTGALALAGDGAGVSAERWRQWMAGDVSGILSAAPVFLARRARDAAGGRRGPALDILAVGAVAALAWAVVASPWAAASAFRDLPVAALLPALFWIGIRRSILASAWSGFVIAAVTTVAIVEGAGLFGPGGRLADPVAFAQILMVTCVLSVLTLAATFEDRRRAKARLESAEERQRIAIEGSGAASWDVDLKTGQGVWSPAHFEFLGLPPSPGGGGTMAAWRERVHPADRAVIDAAFRASLDGRTPYQAEYRVIRADTGEVRWLSGYGRTFLDAAGRPERTVGIMLDVTQRHDLRRTDAFLLRLEDALRDLSSAADIERAAATLLGREIGAGRVFYACVEDEAWGTAGPCHVDGMAPVEGRFGVAAYGAQVVETLRLGRAMAIADSADDPRLDAGDRAAFAAVGTRAALTVGLRKDGRWVAALSAHHPRPHRWTSGEVALVEATAERTWAAIQRVHAERALAASEARFRALFDEAGVGMVVMDAEARMLRVNAAFARIVGRDRAALPGETCLSFTHPDDVADNLAEIARLTSGEGAGAVFETRYLLPDGRPIWVRLNVTRLAGGDLLALVEDVSARVTAEAEVVRLANAVPAFVYRMNADNRTTYANQRWIDYTGLTFAESLGEGSIRAVHPDDRARVGADFQRAIATRTPLATEYRCRRHDGAYRWFYTFAEPELDAEGRIAGWFGTSIDVHDRKQAEALQAARDRRDRFLLRLQDDLRLLTDPDEVARAAIRMLAEELRPGRAAYVEIDDAGDSIHVRHTVLAEGQAEIAGRYPMGEYRTILDLLRDGRPLVVADVLADPRTAAYARRPEIAAMGVRATLDVPLMRDGRVVGLVAVNHPAPRDWSDDEVALAQDVAQRAWAVIGRARSEAALRLKTEELESVVESAPLGAAFFDRDHRYVRINSELAATNGHPPAAHVGQTIGAMRPTLAPAIDALVRRVFETGETARNVEFSCDTPQAPGVIRHWLANFYPVFAGDGRIAQVGVWVIDITERKVAETALRDSEARLRAVIEAMPVGLVFAEAPSGRITLGNALVERIVGHPVLHSPEVGAYRDWVGFHADGRRVEGHEYPLAQAIAGADRPELEVRYQRGDGRLAWIRFVAAPIRNDGGAVVGGVVASIDIDRERRIEAELRELNAALESRVADAVAQREAALTQLHEAQKMETIGQLTGGVAHDFNNLLAAILSNLDLLRKRTTDARAAQLIEGAVRGAERGAALTKRLLAFARRQDLRTERVALPALVEGMRDLLARSLGPAIRIETDVPAGLPAVSVDPNQLELAILNLAVNARDAMPQGGRWPSPPTARPRPRAARCAARPSSACRCPTPGRGWTRPPCGARPSRSSPPRASARAPASACRWSRGSPRSRAGPCRSTARRGGAPASASGCPKPPTPRRRTPTPP